ncbi:Hypothetical predicted protein [Pelobates cultripes]|uniref:Uncharacterized protein n=1 Tax=Pelobates cultripes TaxID=61616 RepID=A0AAD1SHA8_PELCU|nr:Hypothetical predicted protein [Pelobates cultripes]
MLALLQARSERAPPVSSWPTANLYNTSHKRKKAQHAPTTKALTWTVCKPNGAISSTEVETAKEQTSTLHQPLQAMENQVPDNRKAQPQTWDSKPSTLQYRPCSNETRHRVNIFVPLPSLIGGTPWGIAIA